MSQDEFAKIAKAKSQIATVWSTNAMFLETTKANAKAMDRNVSTDLEFKDDELVVNVFGYKVCSKSRVVGTGDDFYMEYRFLASVDNEDHELTRFYVGAGGQVYEDLESETKICDFDNKYIVSHVYRRVAIGLLNSPFFAATEKD
jgi:RNase adaptor protein for sRNA GlmZ degradation